MEEQDPGPCGQRAQDLAQPRRIGAADGDDPAFGRVLVKRAECVLPICGTDDDDVQGLGAAGIHEVGISISWGGPQ